ncbi:phage terminase large subunit [Pannonibacter sp. SL95]|uniref:phage terminase large subunit n=1 Tax=Pannonibacter sp. SL95 TaxID=2995153 RepID=UPI0022734C2E|nr:phage terminase large subunit [Pannonibacter sp. SL95]MCY1708352.1 phage terminase large subunit [Pannonibacter sp. SL95]
MSIREGADEALARWQQLELLQEHYAKFEDFLIDVIEDLLGFTCTELQIDIGQYVAYGPQYRMVQAQRGQAKTTVTAAYAVWRIIHNPATRVLIISAGGDMATEIANWIIQIINGMPELECLRPDRGAGDRESVKAYDIHHSLKGPEKSPSVGCIGITSNMQGKRADLLIADDIESQKNSQTQTQRERLQLLTRDFTSICSKGDVVYLGTPQSIDSVYNDLPGRGFSVRIWPGRYPTPKERLEYGEYLAPYIAVRLARDPSLGSGAGPTGERGQPTDPVLLDDAALIKKEIDQGAAYFQLQHMLSTKLSDENRFPLKLASLRVLAFDRENKSAPMLLQFARTDNCLIEPIPGAPYKDRMYRVANADEFGRITGWHMYVDPAGGGTNGDETAYAITGFLAGRIYLAAVGGVPGGITEDALNALTAVAERWKPDSIGIEKNYGNGALSTTWQPTLLKKHRCSIEDIWETGQKELRIIDTLEPIIGGGKFVVHEDILREDYESIQKYPMELRSTYSLFWQMSRVTRDKGSLIHDDRLDAVAAACRHWTEALAQDDEKVRAKAQQDRYRELMQNPLGTGRPVPGWNQMHGLTGAGVPNALNKLQIGAKPMNRVTIRGLR